MANRFFMTSLRTIENRLSTTPSETFRATFPVKPSLTMTSALPE